MSAAGPGLNRAGVAFMIPELGGLRTRANLAGRTEGDPKRSWHPYLKHSHAQAKRSSFAI
jgi:hypothetical protein